MCPRKESGENEGTEVEHKLTVGLQAHVTQWVVREARRRGMTSERLLIEIITDAVEKNREPLDVRLQRVNRMLRDLVTLANKTLAQEVQEMRQGLVSVATKLPPEFDERKKRRDRLIELGMQAYHELSKISASEEAAKEAECRTRAYLVMARVGAFNAAVIRDEEAEELSDLILEVEEKNEQLDEELEKLRRKRRQMEEDEVHNS